MTEQEKKESLPKQIKAILMAGEELTSGQIQERLGGTYKPSEISRSLAHLRNSGTITRRKIQREGLLGPKEIWANKLADTSSVVGGVQA